MTLDLDEIEARNKQLLNVPSNLSDMELCRLLSKDVPSLISIVQKQHEAIDRACVCNAVNRITGVQCPICDLRQECEEMLSYE